MGYPFLNHWDIIILLVSFMYGMDGLLGVDGMIITSDHGSFPKIPY
jgi:hypothetical protein